MSLCVVLSVISSVGYSGVAFSATPDQVSTQVFAHTHKPLNLAQWNQACASIDQTYALSVQQAQSIYQHSMQGQVTAQSLHAATAALNRSVPMQVENATKKLVH